MPLVKGSTKRSREENIKRLVAEGYTARQAAAIAYRIQRQQAAKKGAKKRRKR